MQIKLATARGLGYTGDAAGLRDPDTNLTGAPNTSPAPIAPPTAITAELCVIMRAAITTLQSASGSNSRCSLCRCWRAAGRRKSSPAGPPECPPTRTRCRPPIANLVSRARCGASLLRRTGTSRMPASGPRLGTQRCALRCVRGMTAVQFRYDALTPRLNRLH